MAVFEVTLTKTRTAVVTIEATTAQEAESVAFDRWYDCQIELSDSGIPGDVDITSRKISE